MLFLYLDQDRRFIGYLDDMGCLARCAWDNATESVIKLVQMLIKNMIRKEATRMIPRVVENQLVQYSMAIPSWYEIVSPKWNKHSI